VKKALVGGRNWPGPYQAAGTKQRDEVLQTEISLSQQCLGERERTFWIGSAQRFGAPGDFGNAATGTVDQAAEKIHAHTRHIDGQQEHARCRNGPQSGDQCA
jgi:hypothetical protein